MDLRTSLKNELKRRDAEGELRLERVQHTALKKQYRDLMDQFVAISNQRTQDFLELNRYKQQLTATQKSYQVLSGQSHEKDLEIQRLQRLVATPVAPPASPPRDPRLAPVHPVRDARFDAPEEIQPSRRHSRRRSRSPVQHRRRSRSRSRLRDHSREPEPEPRRIQVVVTSNKVAYADGMRPGGFEREFVNAHCVLKEVERAENLRRLRFSDPDIRCNNPSHRRTWCWCRHRKGRNYVGVHRAVRSDVFSAIMSNRAKDGITVARFEDGGREMHIGCAVFGVCDNTVVNYKGLSQPH